jgi:thioredoxin reductase (NADPH)
MPTTEAHALMRAGVQPQDIPAVVTISGAVLRQPTLRELADGIGITGRHRRPPVRRGGSRRRAGRAGGRRVRGLGRLDGGGAGCESAGRQAGASSKIENYFGFPTGVSGQALAGRGLSQARKFGAEVAVPVKVSAVNCDSPEYDMQLDSGEKLRARSIVIASGARYRKPTCRDWSALKGAACTTAPPSWKRISAR